MKVRSWREQLESDQRFLVRAVPFAFTCLAVMLEVYVRFEVSWSIASAAGLAAGLLAVFATIRWSVGGVVTLLALVRSVMIVVRTRFS